MPVWQASLLLMAALLPSLAPARFLLYDVNPGEGFNLRRDVFMRLAVLVRKLNQEVEGREKWTLVLPPWGPLYHWQSRDLDRQAALPWAEFFHLDSLRRYIPVMEFTDWLEQTRGRLQAVHYLQGYKEGWQDGKFEEKFDKRECLERPRYRQTEDGTWEGWFFSYGERVRAEQFSCLSVQGHASVLANWLAAGPPGTSIMLDRAENLLHDRFGDGEYWAARRSMRFSPRLVDRAAQFRLEKLDSEDGRDKTMLPADWREEGGAGAARQQRGGQYACLHLRRGDFARSRATQVASPKWAGRQLAAHLTTRGLTSLFVATDGTEAEMTALKSELAGVQVLRYRPTKQELRQFGDGGVAIIDQIICSHARYFIGTRESTFTFRLKLISMIHW